MSENLGTIWVCRCCMLQHANGEHCGDAEYHGDQPEPLCLIEWPNTITMGDGGCECDTNSFSWSWCDGCGSWLGGERHAMTLWREDVR